MIKLNILLFVSIQMIPSSILIGQSKVKTKLIRQSQFLPPIETYLIESIQSVRSLMMCAAICDRHIVCRTADYHSITKECRLFESLASVGSFTPVPFSTVLALDYCPYGDEQEPEYVCTRSGAYSVQEIFIKMNQTDAKNLNSSIRSLYANMHGLYVSDFNGSLSFFGYDGSRIDLIDISTEMTNINEATRNGLIAVHSYTNRSTLFINNGTPWNPNLVQSMQFSLPGQPYHCLVTSQYIYITYCDSKLLFSIHHRHNTSVFLLYNTTASNVRPVLSQWKDKILVIDKDIIREYDVNGSYLGNRAYFSPGNVSYRNYLNHDYAGRRYICNHLGDKLGLHGFLLNGTLLANGLRGCARAVQIYLTKEQAVFASAAASVMRVIDI